MADKKKVVKITTPRGTAKFPWLNNPNTKFAADGVYTVNLLVPEDEAQSLMEQLDEMAEETYQKAVEELKEKKKVAEIKKIQKVEPYSRETDEDGNETGNIEFKFKMPAKVTSKKTGKTITLAPKLFDAKGKPVKNTVIIYGGSIIKVNFSPSLYFMPATKQCGVSLRLNAVQVLDLVSRGGKATDYGFDKEDGYEYAELEDDSLNNDESEATDAAPVDENEDF